MRNSSMEKTVYDVVILGSGIAGSLLGAILARHGAKVLLVDAASHPRFAIGESTIPYTLLYLRVLAERYDVPEIKNLATFTQTRKTMGERFGVKRHFGFLLHHEGQPQNPRETNEFNTPKNLLNEAAHYFRQDTDAYLFHVAIKYGCKARQNFRVEDVSFDDSGVTVSGADAQYRARYVVDASGFRSPLAEKFGLREDPCRLKHHSRSVWNHMLDVTPTDDLFRHGKENRPPFPWYEGTVHHMFERGWAWVIAFDNNKWSTNPLCSVGMTVDPRTYPKPAHLTPEEDFYALAAPYPDIARQFEGAKPVREWVSTGRLQYSSSRCAGDRWFLLSHAAGFIDPLFSRGLSNTAESVHSLASRLLAAVKDDDFSAERFEFVERLQQKLFDYNDSLVNAAFISWRDYPLWTAVFRFWAWGANAGCYQIQRALSRFAEDGNDRHFRDLEQAPHLGHYWGFNDGFAKAYDSMVEQVDAVEAGRLAAGDAADDLYDQMRLADFWPKHFGFAERDVRFISPGPKTLAKMARWARTEADPELGTLMIETGKAALKSRFLKGRKLF
ncbi:tryptophan 7-halogenase [Sphaerisporangium sp. TRM90804]|uniref:NAD(P)/FAD-dependent oxidoreductase n=1 Tax=Sphaerisporangium sp. TRM90804 TaxID=3031113 RepID=UPI00244C0A65|nr:tryptophan 7-halogenase [Sphaerisporangium sp. TRM90804]MDH2427302.1 tryptophan 7-halogenase [Sphaerisporangium sp. TRM90804]